ncbi:capsid protein [Leuconostoc citreum]|uniref:phage tail tube protein n=1 Tax=Leuconostoc citreum TaxID=33964 RepID=UPI0021A8151B|nr:capsid protein [Leuconostoc citreum]MCT3069074.1 capsid protein [Leuconostoc citreum]
MAKTFNENYQNKLEIDTDGNTTLDDVSKASWATLAAGIQTITPSASETADTTPYYDGEGFSSIDVTGKTISFAVAGHRLSGDPAQDYIASKYIAVGETLHTLARWTDPSGKQVQFAATLQAIVPFGGAANAKQTFSFTLAANGKPQAVTTDANSGTTPPGQ